MRTRELLLNDPTRERWREELRLVLGGKRDASVRDLGSVEEYVARLIHDAALTSDAHETFIDALNDEAISWQVRRPNTAYYMRGILQLICAHTPPAGFGKALELVELRGEAIPAGVDEEIAAAIVFTALTALSRYYRTAPPDAARNGAYKQYVSLLEALADDAELGPMALRQLLGLGVADLRDPEFAAGVVADEARLAAAVDFAVLPPNPWSKPNLSLLLAACVRTKSNDVFTRYVASLQGFGIPVIVYEDRIHVSPADGKQIIVEVGPELLNAYALLTWNVVGAAGLMKYDSLTM